MMERKPPVPYHRAKHFILDIETLGVTVPAPILSAGIVVLDLSGDVPSIRSYLLHIDPKQCVGHPETETVQWWLKQTAKARLDAFYAERDKAPFDRFVEIIEEEQPDYFWGKSHDFDFGHMGAQLKALSKTAPWQFWQLRDIRTMEGLGLKYEGDAPIYQQLQSYLKKHRTSHKALNDAYKEAAILCGSLLALAPVQKDEVRDDA